MMREDDLVNEDIGGYRVTAKIIAHTSSSTFLGESISQETSYQNVVIELLYAARTHNEQKQEDIQQKIASLQALHHPHILPILSYGFHKNIPYIMSEYLPSGSLYDRFQRRPDGQLVPIKEAFLTLAQVGQALHYAHQRKVIHGSLTLHDVLFTLQDKALVMGFHRHALLLSNEEDEGNSLERPIYRASEQRADQVSEKSDQYALGGLAYALFTGYRAFMVPSVNTPGAYYKTKALIPPGRLNSALPSYIEEAILKAMSREPDHRYPNIDAFLTALGIPSATGNGDLKETVSTLAQIMKEDFPERPTTPATGIDTFDTVKAPMFFNTIPTRDGNRTNSDTFSHVPPDILGEAQAVTLPHATRPDTLVSASAGKGNQIPFKLQQSYPDSSKPSFRTVGKSFTSSPRRALTVIICLIALMIVGMTIDLSFSASPKRSATAPFTHSTSTTHSLKQTSALGATATIRQSRPSTIGINVPSRKATPQQTTVPTTAPTSAPTTVPTSASAPTQIQVALNSFFNNEGLGNTPGLANFDGSGYSYPASQLPAGGKIRIQGIPYQFPSNGPGTNDNIVASGQTIPLTAGSYRQAYLLAASSWGPITGTVVIKYTDGSTNTINLTIPDWYSNSGVLNAGYRYTSNGTDNNPVSIYVIPIKLNSTRRADALILPGPQSGPHQNGLIHVFALTLLS